MYVCMHACMHVCMYVCTHIHTHGHTHTSDATPVLRAMYTNVVALIGGLNYAAPFLQLTSLFHLKVARLSFRSPV